ncbi:MAG: caspase family protein, partial [Acidobacteria bacterium]|nr:caspase family protein [Acidobacteriota bacterium]
LVAALNSGFEVWDAFTGDHVATLKTGSQSAESYEVSPSGDSLVWTTSADGVTEEIMMWRFDQPRSVRIDPDGTGEKGWRTNYAYAPDGKMIGITGFKDEGRDTGHAFVALIDSVTQKEARRIESPQGPRQWKIALAFDRTSKQLAISRGNGFRVYDVATGATLRRFEGVANQATAASLSRTGDDLAYYVEGGQAQWREAGNWREAGAKAWGIMLWRLSDSESSPGLIHRELLPWSDNSPEEKATRQSIRYHSRYISTITVDLTGIDLAKPPSELDWWKLLKVNVRNVADTSKFAAAEQIINQRMSAGDVRLWHAEVSPDAKAIALEVVDSQAVGNHFDDAEFRHTLGSIELWDLRSGKRLWKANLPDSEYIISFSNDGKVVSAGSVRLDAVTGTRLPDMTADKLTPEQLEAYGAFTINGRNVSVRNASTCVEIRDRVSHRLIAQLYWLNDDDWAVITPSGLFDASEGAQAAMHFMVADPEVGYQLITLDQLKATYYVPGLLHKLFYQPQDLPKVGDFSITLPPKVNTDLLRNQLGVKIDAVNRGGGIGRMEVRVNGVEVTADARGENTAAATASNAEFKVDIGSRLHKGENKVEVIPWNLEGNVRGLPEAFLVDVKPGNSVPVIAAKGSDEVPEVETKTPSDINFYAIISGIADYQGTAIDLRFSAKDAENISEAMTLAARKYFCAEGMAANKPCERVHIRLLSTEQDKQTQFAGLPDVPDLKRLDPVKSGFRDAFAEVAAKAKPEDVVFVYMSGHGTAITSEQAVKESAFADMYLYPTRDASTLDREVLSNPTEREAKTVSSLDLANWLSNIKADKRVMVLDTCAAGAVEKDLIAQARAVDALQVRSIDRLRERSGFYILMGAAGDAQSFEANQFRQGLLT